MRYDLTRIPLLKAILRSRWPQFLSTVVALGGFLLAIAAGFFGTTVGSRNFSIVFVWIAWWAILMLAAVPFFGRGWCSICPIPAPGEWLQRGALLGPGDHGSSKHASGLSLGRRWPSRLRNIWLQNGAFTLTALFSALVLTQPSLTAVVLAGFLFTAVGVSLVFERRAFCRYLCPVGGFIGLYSQLAPLEVRVKDTAVCAAHTEKTCYTGSSDGYGCPWLIYPGGLTRNTYCGTCMECLRTCPQDNIAIHIRPPAADLAVSRGRRMDEAFKAFIMLGSALVYAAVLLGPWGALKSAAYAVGSGGWWGYTLAFVAIIFGILPGLFLLMVALGRRLSRSTQGLRQAFISFSYALVPLGMAAWIAFSLSFVLANLSYLLPALSDPFGWGWDLFGTSQTAWTPYLSDWVPLLQVSVLLGGLIGAGVTARQIALEKLTARSAVVHSLPVITFCLAATVGMLGLLVA